MLTLWGGSCCSLRARTWSADEADCLGAAGPNSVGVSGLIHIPTAEVPPVGSLLLSGGNVPTRMVPGDLRTERLHHYAVGMVLLPGLETTLNFTLLRLHGARHYNNQDRNGSVRLRLVPQGRWTPQVVVGATSLLVERGSSWWQNYYAVATRRVHSERHGTLAFTLGYYFPWGRYARYYDRPFGGLAWTPQLLPAPFERFFSLSFMGEYDSRQWNYGVRCSVLERLCYTMALTASGQWTWQVGYRVQL
jgi:hypothetical protein